jgi:hypothetical protein
MVIFDRLRELHDDIAFRRYPDLRAHAPLMFAAMFLIVLATTLGTTYFGETSTIAKPEFHAKIDYPVLGATLRLSRFSDRPERTADTPRARARSRRQ